jgi:uncharacterized phiE125 gp8 family phage protein
MTKRQIIPPVEMAVSIEAARRAARTSGPAFDAELEERVRGITEEVEHRLGRALITQTWEVALDYFPGAREIKLPMPRLQSVKHVKFYDAAGELRALHPDDYSVDSKSEPGWVMPAPGVAWPATQPQRANAVEIQYVCGYGPTEADIPPAIKEYIVGMIENHYYPNPNAKYLERRLDRFKVYG